MPKEQESELRHLGSNALHQMHVSCVKKGPVFRQRELSEFDVLSDLKNLSNKTDRLPERELQDADLDKWFDAVRKTLEDIRDCKNVKDIQYPSSIETFTDMKNKGAKSPAATATPVLQMTMSATKEITPAKKVIASSASKMVTPNIKEITPDTKPETSDKGMVTPATSVWKNLNPSILLDQLNLDANANKNENSLKSNHIKPQAAFQTPALNVTFDLMNATRVLDSGSATNSNQNSIAIGTCNDSDVKARSSSKRKNLNSTKKENACPNSHGMLTRSGSKRKSSDSKNKSSKKPKIDSFGISSATLNKTAQPRHPLRDLKTSVLASENKKLSAVVKPPVLQKPSLVSKEQQILEELKKKEKKRDENLQRIMAERQQKAEQNKKTREEKRTKTLQKRLQMEKEREEKREIELKKSQVKANQENPKKTTRAKEIVEQHIKESKTSNVISSTQSISNANDIVKTPAPRKSEDCESYELTPLPDSSTYNFSDDEDDKPASNKRIPTWAQGVHLKSALIQQYYHPVDTNELFGSIIESPNLVEIFKINKKRYMKRTSSAIWNSPPNRSFHY